VDNYLNINLSILNKMEKQILNNLAKLGIILGIIAMVIFGYLIIFG